ncbi:MAG: SiaB family protein kinase [Flavobacteriales bacterium]|nr:SiaB family protein kinase [Flavobacteriales bacterium]
MIDVFDFYNKMENNNIMLSFKGSITSELLTSILNIIEKKMVQMDESSKVQKKVFNVLVECLQNLYHHREEIPVISEHDTEKSAIFMIGKDVERYNIITGNYMIRSEVDALKQRIDFINSLSNRELKERYKEVLNDGTMSEKGGGGLGLMDIARKSGQNLDYDFLDLDDKFSFFTLGIKVAIN